MRLSDTGDLSGRAHLQALETLLEHHDEVVKCAQPSVIVVEGASGVGKSRLLLELYRALSRRQAEPRYWPEPDSSWNGYPASVRPFAAPMQYFWWGIPCPAEGSARPFQVLADEITQIEAHAALLIAADDETRVYVDVARDSAVDAATGLVTDLVPGSATAVALGRSLLRVLRARGRVRTLDEQLREGALIDATDVNREGLVLQAQKAMTELGERVPIVLVVDDGQSADASLADLLAAALAMQARIQIVISSRPTVSGRALLAPLLDSIPAERHLVIGNLAEDDAVDMVTARTPRAPRDVVLAIARKSAGNPRSIESLLDLLPLEDETVLVELRDVEALPDDYVDQLGQLWTDTLPPETKKILSAAAAVCSPEGDLVARLLVGALSTMRPEDRIGADLDEAVARYQWLVRHGSIVRFAEPQRRLVATKRSVLMQREREELISIVLGTLVELTKSREIERVGTRDRRTLLETHVKLAREGCSREHLADAEAAFELSSLVEKIGDEKEALTLREQAIAWAFKAGVDGRALINLRSSLVGLLLQNDRSADAEAVLQELTDSASPGSLWSAIASMNALVLEMRRDDPTASGVVALADAVEAFDQQNPLGREAISGHVNLAFFLNRLGRHDEALQHHQIVRERLEENKDPEADATVFQTEINIAATLRGAAGLAASMDAFDALDARLLDPDDRQRVCLARLRVLDVAATERDSGTAAYLAVALPRGLKLLGARHRDVRVSVNILGELLLSQGEFQAAVDLYREYPAPIDLPNADEVDLSSAFNHAIGLMGSEQQVEAVPILDAVVRRATDLVGEDQELTLTAIAHLIDAAIDVDETEIAARAVSTWILGLGARHEWGKAAHDRLLELDGLVSGGGYPDAVPALLESAREIAIERRDAIAHLYLNQWIAGFFLLAGRGEPARKRAAVASELATEAIELATALGHDETRLACQLIAAEARLALNEADKAIAIYRSIDEQVGSILGDDHPIGIGARQRLQELGS